MFHLCEKPSVKSVWKLRKVFLKTGQMFEIFRIGIVSLYLCLLTSTFNYVLLNIKWTSRTLTQHLSFQASGITIWHFQKDSENTIRFWWHLPTYNLIHFGVDWIAAHAKNEAFCNLWRRGGVHVALGRVDNGEQAPTKYIHCSPPHNRNTGE